MNQLSCPMPDSPAKDGMASSLATTERRFAWVAAARGAAPSTHTDTTRAGGWLAFIHGSHRVQDTHAS